jgi:hypothetical protein
MVDFAKCEGVGCEKKLLCRRFTAVASGRQSWFISSPIVYNDYEGSTTGNCKYFWMVEEECGDE